MHVYTSVKSAAVSAPSIFDSVIKCTAVGT